MLWLSSKPLYLGLDIHADSIRAVELFFTPGAERVTAYGSQALPPGAVEGHQILQPDVVSTAIQQLVQKGQFKSTHVAIALPDSAVMNKILFLEKGLSDDEMEAYLLLEAETFIPFPTSELHFDFHILGPSTDGRLEVLLVTTHHNHLQSRLEILEHAGLKAQNVDVQSLVVQRSLKTLLSAEQEDGIVTALLNLGPRFSQFFVLHHAHKMFVREEKYGWESVDQSRFIGDLSLHIKRSVQLFLLTHQANAVSKLFIMGHPAHSPYFITLLQEELAFPVYEANPFARLMLENHLKIPLDPSVYLMACALASKRGKS